MKTSRRPRPRRRLCAEEVLDVLRRHSVSAVWLLHELGLGDRRRRELEALLEMLVLHGRVRYWPNRGVYELIQGGGGDE